MYRNRICQCQRPIVFLLIFHDPAIPKIYTHDHFLIFPKNPYDFSNVAICYFIVVFCLHDSVTFPVNIPAICDFRITETLWIRNVTQYQIQCIRTCFRIFSKRWHHLHFFQRTVSLQYFFSIDLLYLSRSLLRCGSRNKLKGIIKHQIQLILIDLNGILADGGIPFLSETFI